MAKPQHGQEERADTDLLTGMRLKAFGAFIGILMTLYSFFGSIYRMPMQLEMHTKELLTIQQNIEKQANKLSTLEMTIIGRSEIIAESVRTRQRVDLLEKQVVTHGLMQQQIIKVEEVTRELTRQLDLLNSHVLELNINANNLKDSVADMRRTLQDEVKKKQP